MSPETGLYREFAKAFARKIAYVLCWAGIFLVAVSAIVGVMHVAVEIATFILNATAIKNTRLTHFSLTLGVLVSFAGLLGTAYLAWEEAKADMEGK